MTNALTNPHQILYRWLDFLISIEINNNEELVFEFKIPGEIEFDFDWEKLKTFFVSLHSESRMERIPLSPAAHMMRPGPTRLTMVMHKHLTQQWKEYCTQKRLNG